MGAIKKPILKKPKMKIAIHKPHMTGTSCGSRPPQYQAACYRSRHQKVPKFALDAEKKAKIAIKKPKISLKIHKPKIVGKKTTTPKKKISLKIHKPKIVGKKTTTPKKPKISLK